MRANPLLRLTLGLLLACCEAAADSPAGRLCLAAAPTPTAGARSLANPTGGLPDVVYSIRIVKRAPINLSRSRAQWVTGLPVGERQLIVVQADGRAIESFYFTFDDRTSEDLCLAMKPLYQTWVLWPLAQTGAWCACGAPPEEQAGYAEGQELP